MKTIESTETTDPGEKMIIITNALATMRGKETPGSKRGEKTSEILTLIFLDLTERTFNRNLKLNSEIVI